MTRSTPRDGGAAVAYALKAAGVTTVFTLHGGHLDSIFHACLDQGIELVDTRHESAAGHAAEGWAKATGQIGVCMITAGPGFTNGMTAIANAYLDGTPTLFIIGAPPLREAGLNVLQGGLDQIAMAKPVTKRAIQITDPTRIIDQMALAIDCAVTGRPGPVLVELPIDVLARPCTPCDLDRTVSRPRPSAPDAATIDEAIAILQQAARPVLILGGLARYEAEAASVTRFCEVSGIPVVSSTRALGLADPTAPSYAHTLDTLPTAAAIGVGSADAALMLGARFGLFMGGRSEAYLPADCAVIQVHADPAEFSAVRTPALSSTANCGRFLDGLAKAWRKPADAIREWRDALGGIPAAIEGSFARETPSGRIHPYFAAKEVIASAPADTLFVQDGGEANFWAAYHVRTRRPGGVLAFGQLGALGTGMGMALGAATARPNQPVLHIIGDGAMGFHIQEFETFARHKRPIVTVILNNSCWGMSIHGQQILYGDNYNCVSLLPDTPYQDVARAMGCHGERVDRIEDIGPAMARAFASGLPACVNVMTAPEIVLPATAAMLGEPGANEIMVPYYENIPA